MRLIRTLIIPSLVLLLPFATAASTFEGSINADASVPAIVITTPSADPGAGSYTSPQSVTLSADGASSISYTTDGSSPACDEGGNGTTFSSAIDISSSLTIQTLSCYDDGNVSDIVSFEYVITTPTPESTPPTDTGGGNGPPAGSLLGGSGGGGGAGNTIETISDNSTTTASTTDTFVEDAQSGGIGTSTSSQDGGDNATTTVAHSGGTKKITIVNAAQVAGAAAAISLGGRGSPLDFADSWWWMPLLFLILLLLNWLWRKYRERSRRARR